MNRTDTEVIRSVETVCRNAYPERTAACVVSGVAGSLTSRSVLAAFVLPLPQLLNPTALA